MAEVNFRDLGLSEATLGAIEAAGFVHPTPIQIAAVPALLTTRDAILRAQTGTGKTAAFGLPMIERIDPAAKGVRGLVLTPTRELAQQVANEISRLGSGKGIAAAAVYGGAAFEQQLAEVASAQIVIATPGRLLDVVKRKRVDLSRVEVFGLDEADEMLSLGFEKDVRDIAGRVPKQRQTFLCSATIADDVKRLAADLLNDAQEIDCSSDEVGARSVRHELFETPMGTKLEAFFRILATEKVDGAIVFANTRAETFRVHQALLAEGFQAGVLNGDLSQDERERALAKMRGDHIQFLVATDVAARGIDISGLPAVINYDMPEAAEVYIHRTGRTGRAGQFGVAFSLLTAADVVCMNMLRKFYGIPLHLRALPSAEAVKEARAARAINAFVAGIDPDDTLPYGRYLPFARRLTQEPAAARTIAKLFAAAARTPAPTLAEPPPPATGVSADAPADTRVAPPAAPSPRPAAPAAEAPVPANQETAGFEAPAVETSAPAEAAPEAPSGRERGRRRGERGRDRRGRDEQPGRSDEASSTPAEVAVEVTVASIPAADVPTAADDEAGDPRAPSVTGDAVTADQIADWLSNVGKSRRRGRWRSDESLALVFKVPAARVVELLTGHADIEASEGPRRLFKSKRASGNASRPVEAGSQPATAPATLSASTPPLGDEQGARTRRDRDGRSRGGRNESRHGAAQQAPAASKPEAAAPATPAPRQGEPPRAERRDRSSDRSRRDRRGGRGSQAVAIPLPQPEPEKFVELRLNLGSDAFESSEALLGKLAELAGLEVEDFGPVQLHASHSTVQIRESYARDLVAAVRDARVQGRTLSVQLPSKAGPRRS
jgi:ATP-dependent RNA helicase DeaD